MATSADEPANEAASSPNGSAAAAATVWEDGPCRAAPEAVDELLGPARARLLIALRSPATTTALARRLGVTPGAVSQHLAVLHRAGLVDRQRSGRTVLYQASELGLALLAGRPVLQVSREPVGHL